MMTRLPFEPTVRVGICENEAFGLKPIGSFQINASENQITYTPLAPDSHMEVSGMTIGRCFHWQSRLTLRYHGVFTLTRDKTGNSRLVNFIKAEEYLKSVVSSEMNPKAPSEYLKAHAIISRSWLMRILSRNSDMPSLTLKSPQRFISYTQNDTHSHFDVCADDHCQRYQGIDNINDKAYKAVRDTHSLILVDAEGKIADTRFSKCCGGTTELFSTAWNDKDFAYLPAKDDPYCNPDILSAEESAALHDCLKEYDATTSYYRWKTHIDSALIRQNIMSLYGEDIGEILALTPSRIGPSGRICELSIQGSLRSCNIGKELTIRKILSNTHLLSSAFTIHPETDGFTLRGKGWGHGVGLCQTGAAVMALRGFTCNEILEFYYPGTRITSYYD